MICPILTSAMDSIIGEMEEDQGPETRCIPLVKKRKTNELRADQYYLMDRLLSQIEPEATLYKELCANIASTVKCSISIVYKRHRSRS